MKAIVFQEAAECVDIVWRGTNGIKNARVRAWGFVAGNERTVTPIPLTASDVAQLSKGGDPRTLLVNSLNADRINYELVWSVL